MPIYIALTPFKFAKVRVPQGAVVEASKGAAAELLALKVIGPAPEGAKPSVVFGGAQRGDGSGFPEEFPGKEALEAAGFTDPNQLLGKSADELGAIKGIGPATVKKLLALAGEA